MLEPLYSLTEDIQCAELQYIFIFLNKMPMIVLWLKIYRFFRFGLFDRHLKFLNLLDFWKVQKMSEFLFLSALSGLNLKNYYNKGLKESTLENTRDKIWIRKKKYQRPCRTGSTWLRWYCRYNSYIKNNSMFKNIIIILLKTLFQYRQ